MTQNRRRGHCPGLAVPMATGDGLLARLMPGAPVPLDAMAALCAAARTHGNGIIEVTARGSLQVRGLTADSAALFATEVAALGVAAQEGVAVIASGDGCADLLASQLRHAIATANLTLSPKVSVIVDGGGAFHLDGLSADVRLRAVEAGPGQRSVIERFHLGLGCHRGDGTARAGGSDDAATTWLGMVAPEATVAAVTAILTILAAHGPAMRIADVVARDGVAAFGAVGGIAPAAAPPPRMPAEVIGLHAIRDGASALAIGFAFGQTHADALLLLLGAAARVGVRAVRPAPGRAMLLDGVPTASARDLIVTAEQQGFVVRGDDPRRRIAACPGGPACASGLIPARTLAATLAPLVAAVAGGNGAVVHVSGCSKGCAHPAPARLTVVGAPQGCAVIRDGCAGDAPHHYADPARLSGEIERLAPGFVAAEAAHG